MEQSDFTVDGGVRAITGRNKKKEQKGNLLKRKEGKTKGRGRKE